MIFEESKKTSFYEDEKRTSFVYDDSVVCVIWKEGVVIEKEDAENTMSYAIENYNKGRLMPTFVELTHIKNMTREARDYFQNTNTGTSSALALVVASSLSRVMGNLFISMNQSGVPLKLFNDDAQAMEWLYTYK